ncbi:polysaccharide lyase family 7 protein [Paenibacillus sp. FSL H8-0457]|uniref:polysaccharide lyase family 7 protein n=1 Tax=unclassified Paenibacillus TaxID=185978 RepID=UPI0003E25269|nr:polysaccharide lyase family 7 protein [Paenibacillus sp. FSL H8-457]ETT58719.1 polu(beta-D-mannuronate) lyase [Paenibacillus sp. FSL H8-457]
MKRRFALPKRITFCLISAAMLLAPLFEGQSMAANESKYPASASASSYDTRCACDASKAVDGNLSTRWSGEGKGTWLRLDLGSAQTVSLVKIAFYNGDSRTFTFDIQTSSDGSNWLQARNAVTSALNNQLQSFSIPVAEARYVRIVGYGNTSNDWNSYTEVEIWGDPTDGGGGALDPAKPPSGNFDLTKWKITLPDASEIPASALAGGYEHPGWFYTDPVSGGMVFTSPNIGETTTNSTYTRSELREMLNPSTNSASSWANNWVTSTSSPSIKSQAGGVDGTMKATLRVDRVSVSGNEADKIGRVVVGQIHGPSTEPIRLYYHKRPSDSRGAVYFGTDDLDNNNTWVNILGGPNQLNPVNGIALGQTWSYEIKVTGLFMTVKVIPEGGSATTVNHTLPSGYNDKYLYFKAGVYNQNKSDTTSDQSDHVKATFFSLTHMHP